MTEYTERDHDVEKKLPRTYDDLLVYVNEKVAREKKGYWVGEMEPKPLSGSRDVFFPRLTGGQLRVINEEVLNAYMTVEEAHILLGWRTSLMTGWSSFGPCPSARNCSTK